MGQKIKISEARASGAEGLLVSCCGPAAMHGGCRRSVQIAIGDAVAIWGPSARLDDLRLVCSACGSRTVDVRPNYPTGSASTELDRLLREAWNRES